MRRNLINPCCLIFVLIHLVGLVLIVEYMTAINTDVVLNKERKLYAEITEPTTQKIEESSPYYTKDDTIGNLRNNNLKPDRNGGTGAVGTTSATFVKKENDTIASEEQLARLQRLQQEVMELEDGLGATQPQENGTGSSAPLVEIIQNLKKLLEESNNLMQNGTIDEPHRTKTAEEQLARLREPSPNVLVHPESPHLLSLPFYVYEDMLRDPTIFNFTEMCILSLNNVTFCTVENNVTTFEDIFRVMKDYKEGGDYHFVNSALNHPMRTTNPEDAKLFVVPFLFQNRAKRYFYPGHKLERPITDRMLQDLDNRLNKTKYFQRHGGKDHILYHASWSLGFWDKNQKYLNALNKCNLIQFYEGAGPQNKWVHGPGYENKRFHFASQYVNGPPCNENTCVNHLNPDKMKDIVFVGAMNRPRGRNTNHKLQDRRKVCALIKGSRYNFTYDACGTGARCPNICGAKLGLHFRGDSLSANRINDYFSVGTIPIVTREQLYEAMPSFVDYSQLTYFIDVTNTTLFESNLHRILSNKSDLELKRRNILKNRDLFVWESGVPFDVYMYQFQARIYPETRVQRSRFPALIMPWGNSSNSY